MYGFFLILHKVESIKYGFAMFILMTSLGGAIMEVVYLLGALCGIYFIWELFALKTSISLVWRIAIAVLILCISWVGLAAYYFLVRDRI